MKIVVRGNVGQPRCTVRRVIFGYIDVCHGKSIGNISRRVCFRGRAVWKTLRYRAASGRTETLEEQIAVLPPPAPPPRVRHRVSTKIVRTAVANDSDERTIINGVVLYSVNRRALTIAALRARNLNGKTAGDKTLPNSGALFRSYGIVFCPFKTAAPIVRIPDNRGQGNITHLPSDKRPMTKRKRSVSDGPLRVWPADVCRSTNPSIMHTRFAYDRVFKDVFNP